MLRSRLLSFAIGALSLFAIPLQTWAQDEPPIDGGTSTLPPGYTTGAGPESYFSGVAAEQAWFVNEGTPSVPGESFGISPEIRELAKGLQNDPVRIFNYVRNEISSRLYFGFKKGPRMTLLEQSGNDLDKAMLLAALLKAPDVDGQFGPYAANCKIVTGWQELDYFSGAANTPDVSSLWRVDPAADPQGRYITNSSASQADRQLQFAVSVATGAGYANDQRIVKLPSGKIKLRRFWLEANGTQLDPWSMAYRRVAKSPILDSMNWSFDPVLAAGGQIGATNGMLYWDPGLATAQAPTILRDLVVGNGSQEGLLQKLKTPGALGVVNLDSLLGRYKPVKVQFPGLPELAGLTYESKGIPAKMLCPRLILRLGEGVQSSTALPENHTATLTVPALEGSQFSLHFDSTQNRRANLVLENHAGTSGSSIIAQFTVANNTVMAVGLDIHYVPPLKVVIVPNPNWDSRAYLSRNTQAAVQFQAMHTFFYGFTAQEGLLRYRQQKLNELIHAIELAHPGSTSGSAGFAWNTFTADERRSLNREMLGLHGLTWLQQTQHARETIGDVFDANLDREFSFGRMSQDGSYFIDAFFQIGIPASRIGKHAGKGGETAALQSCMLIESALEHGLIEQIGSDTGVVGGNDAFLRAASTVNVLSGGTSFAVITGKTGSNQMFEPDANDNIDELVNGLVPYPAGKTAEINRLRTMMQSASDSAASLSQQSPPAVLWRGTMFYANSKPTIGSIESFPTQVEPAFPTPTKPFSGDATLGIKKVIMRVGGANGGYSSSGTGLFRDPLYNKYYAGNAICDYNQALLGLLTDWPGTSYNQPVIFGGDPVNIATGSFEHAEVDLEQGDGKAPRNLSFQRFYSSGDAHQNTAALGYGWTHNWDIRITEDTSAAFSMGNGTAAQSAPFIVAAKILQQHLNPVAYKTPTTTQGGLPVMEIDPATTNPQQWMSMIMTSKWAVDQFTRSAITAVMGNEHEMFLRMPDGKYEPAAGSTMTLDWDSSTRKFTLKQRGGSTIVFRPLRGGLSYLQGKAESMTGIDGQVLTFDWVENGLSQVEGAVSAGLKRGLKFTYAATGSHPLQSVKLYEGTGSGTTNARTVQYTYSGGDLATVTDPENLSPAVAGLGNLGKHATYLYSESNTAPAGFNMTGRMTTLKNAEDQTVVRNFYDSMGQVISQLAGDDLLPWTFRYGGRRNDEIDPLGGVKQHYYDELGRLEREVDEEGYATSFKYDEEGRQTEEIDAVGARVVTEYDTRHNPVRVKRYESATQTVPWVVETVYDTAAEDPLQRQKKVIDQLGRETVFTYDSSSYSPKTVTTAGSVVTNVYETAAGWNKGQLKSVTDRDGLVSNTVYNAQGYVFTQSSPEATGLKTFTGYDVLGKPSTIVDGNGRTQTLTYNNRGQETKAEQTTGNAAYKSLSKTGYDAQGRATKKEVGTGRLGSNITATTYSPTDKPETSRYAGADGVLSTADDVTETWEYDERDLEIRHTDVSNQVTVTEYRKNGLAKKTELPADPKLGARFKEVSYDPGGRPELTKDVLGRPTSIARSDYESFSTSSGTIQGTRETTTDPMGFSVSRWEDSAERLRKLSDARGKVYEFTYDEFNNPTSIKTPSGKVFSQTPYPSGKLDSENRNGTLVDYTYQPVTGRPASIVFPDAVLSYTSYDAAGQLLESSETATGGTAKVVKRTYDEFNRVKTYTNTEGWTIGYEYHSDGLLKKIWYPETRNDLNPFDNPKTVTYDYDEAGRLKSVKDWDNRTTLYFWRTDGKLERIERFNGTKRVLTYDGAARINSIAERTSAGSILWYNRFDYRKTDELDKRFNYPSVAQNVPTSPWSGGIFDSDNALTSVGGTTVNHDARGNTTGVPLDMENPALKASLTFDSRDRLTDIGSTHYTYNQDGDRVKMTRSGQNTEYVFDPFGGKLTRVLIKLNPDGSTTRCIWGIGLEYEVETPATGTASVRVHHSDHTGSSVIVSDSAGAVTARQAYDPYGRVVSRTGTWSSIFGYGGCFGIVTDPDGLVWMRARFYSPALGRFLSMDPSRFKGGLNWYAYASGNPMSFGDPSGLDSESVLDLIQDTLGWAGMAPGVGALPDLLNMGISLARGNYAEAGMNALAVIPLFGDAFAVGRKGVKFAKGFEKYASSTTDFVKNTGTLAGKRATTRQLNAAQKELAGYDISMNRRFNGKGGAFDWGNAPAVSLMKHPTEIQLLHEMTHARQFNELGREAYQNLGRYARESHVFNTIWENRSNFNRAEVRDAIGYMRDLRSKFRMGGID